MEIFSVCQVLQLLHCFQAFLVHSQVKFCTFAVSLGKLQIELILLEQIL